MLLTTVIILGLGLAAGILVGLLGIGGGIILVPVMVYVLKMEQHTAQGTSLFILLPPIGLGALREYWKHGEVDLRAGFLCAAGMFAGAFGGSLIALPMAARHLEAIFGCFMVLAAILLWDKSYDQATPQKMVELKWRDTQILLVAIFCGVISGMVGIGGGVLLVPLLVLFFSFSQHRAQGTSLIALVPPTGMLAFLMYARAGYVSWGTGALLIPSVFLGGIAGAHLVTKIEPLLLRRIFAAILFVLGAWQAVAAWVR